MVSTCGWSECKRLEHLKKVVSSIHDFCVWRKFDWEKDPTFCIQ